MGDVKEDEIVLDAKYASITYTADSSMGLADIRTHLHKGLQEYVSNYVASLIKEEDLFLDQPVGLNFDVKTRTVRGTVFFCIRILPNNPTLGFGAKTVYKAKKPKPPKSNIKTRRQVRAII